MVGILLSAFPVVRPVGSMMAIAGAIWFLLGRGIFGEKHSKQVIRFSVIFAVGSFFVLVGSIAYLVFVLSISGPSFPLYWNGNNAFAVAVAGSLNSILGIEALGAVMTGIAYAFFTYYLQRPVERALLLAGLAINFATAFLVFLILSSDLSSTVILYTPTEFTAYFNGNLGSDVAHAFENHVATVSLLNLIPSLIYVSAYYAAYSRLKRDYPFD